MKPMFGYWIGFLGAAFCACIAADEPGDEPEEDLELVEQAGMSMQGSQMQGMSMQGSQMQGMSMQGFRFDGATLAGASLKNMRVERGELIAERGGTTLRGAALAGARLVAQVRNLTVDPPATALLTYRIAAIAPEDAGYDPTHTGFTYLYTLEQWVQELGAWRPACPVDSDGRRAALPLAATWDERGDRLESSTLFTFACTTGVLAKCYRWGYRPWLTGYGHDMEEMHWTCTRLARADYCGDGVPHTQDGTWVNVWDNLPAPGPIQRHGLLPPIGMLFEAGWSPQGATCVSHARWLTIAGLIVQACPDRLILPGLGPLLCNSQLEALLVAPSARMFNESYLNLDL